MSTKSCTEAILRMCRAGLKNVAGYYQYREHLGSSVIEANELGQVISYEEYYPYGRSAYRAAASGVDLSLKRYRFTGKERDEETGLDYFGVRYYASWLGRWTSGDPGGFVDGLNLYRYVRNNPINGIDREGYSTEEVEKPKPPPAKKKEKVNILEGGNPLGAAAEEITVTADPVIPNNGTDYFDQYGNYLGMRKAEEGEKSSIVILNLGVLEKKKDGKIIRFAYNKEMRGNAERALEISEIFLQDDKGEITEENLNSLDLTATNIRDYKFHGRKYANGNDIRTYVGIATHYYSIAGYDPKELHYKRVVPDLSRLGAKENATTQIVDGERQIFMGIRGTAVKDKSGRILEIYYQAPEYVYTPADFISVLQHEHQHFLTTFKKDDDGNYVLKFEEESQELLENHLDIYIHQRDQEAFKSVNNDYYLRNNGKVKEFIDKLSNEEKRKEYTKKLYRARR